MKPSFSLEEIYNHTVIDKLFEIPTVQRGYVWKPHQIENLWDSLLRGYPIGAIVLSQKNEKEFNILDGQQRITSICLGMLDKNCQVLKSTSENFKLFIDLEVPPEADSRMFYFRVITRSHPWGYLKSDNKKTLKKEQIRNFYKRAFIEGDSFFDANLNEIYPHDSKSPIPFEIFINAARQDLDVSEVIARVELWRHNIWKKDEVNELDKKIHFYKIEEIYSYVKKLFCKNKGTKIPALYLDLNCSMIKPFHKIENEDIGEEEDIDDGLDEIENMFVRMNSAGTPLSGEELNYSLLKTYLDDGTKNKIEDVCRNKYNPARLITIYYRLWKQSSKNEPFYRISVKPKDFQSEIRDPSGRKDFKKFLEANLHAVSILENTLLLENNNLLGMPFILIRKIPQRSPELFYMLLYRIIFRKDNFNKIPKDKIIGLFTILYWLGTGKQKTGYQQLLRNIFPILINAESDVFWSSSLLERAILKNDAGDVLPELPKSLDDLNEIIIDTDRKGIGFQNLFLYKIIHEKDILIYKQRSYLKNKFDTFLFSLDDTNVPFDWDHIFPQDFIRSKKGINSSLKRWYQTNGNFWACSYDYNRKFQDDNPLSKLEKKNLAEEGITFDEILITDDDFKVLNCTKDSITSDAKQRDVKKFIIDRNKKIIFKWFEELNLFQLIPGRNNEKDDNIFLNKFFKKNSSWFVPANSERKGDPGEVYSLYLEMIINNEYTLYFAACDEGLLVGNDIEVGIVSNTKLKNVESGNIEEFDGRCCTYHFFTLLSRLTVNELFININSYIKQVVKLNSLEGLEIDRKFENSLIKQVNT